MNISTEKWPPRVRTYFGSLDVRSPQPGEAYAITPIYSRRGVTDLGDKRTHEIFISAQEIAEDLARELNGDSGEGSFDGVFVAAGPQPTEEELADARRRLEEFQRCLVAASDLEWERTKNPILTSDLDRRAARQLGVEKPWLYDPKPMAECLPALRRLNQASRCAARAVRSSTKKKLRSSASPHQKSAGKDPTPRRKPTGQGRRPNQKWCSALTEFFGACLRQAFLRKSCPFR